MRPGLRRPALSALVLLLAGCAGGGGPVRELRLGHGLDISHPVHRAMEHLGERLAELSDGRLTLRIYPSEQLGSERECLELLQIGSLAMTKVSSSVLESFAPDFGVLGTPYLFSDREHFFATLNGDVGRRLLLSAEPKRLRGLVFYDAGSRSFYTRERPINSPADLEGLKIRTQESASAMAMVRALGGAPTPISWGELYTALQQGVVDGAENNPPSFHLSRHYEVARFYSLDEHTSVPDVLLVSSDVWSRLSPQEQDWLQRAADASGQVQRRLWREAEEEALEAVTAAGVEVVRPAKAPFQERTRQLLEAYADRPDLVALIEEIRGLDMRAGSAP
ncbi:MAG: TRAP transporter substrate-binding protein [Acidobacteriota bacterium]